jgi:hypothetical protein
MSAITDAAVWIIGGLVLVVLRAIAEASAPFCRNQPTYQEDI